MRNISKIIVIIYILHFLQRRFYKKKHRSCRKNNVFEIYKRRNFNDDEKHSEKKLENIKKNSCKMRRIISQARVFFRFDKIRVNLFSSFDFVIRLRNDL